MRATSQIWDDLYASNVGGLETRAVINGTEYTATSAPLITRSAMQDAMTVGNVISASCVFTIRTDNVIPKSAQVTIKSRLTDGETSSEWLPMGTFFIAKRVKDPLNGLVTFECYDSLLKANAAADLTLPATMEDIVDDIAEAIGVNIDSRTTILTGGAYTINKIPSSATYRDVLGMIAAANCGNFIITPDNELRLVPLVSLPDPEDEITNLVTVKTFTGTIEIGDERTVTGVLYTDGDAMPVLIGDETGIVVNVSLTYAQATALAQVIIGMTYKPYTITNAWYNPAAEIGDYIAYSNRVLNVIWAETAQYGSGFTGDVSAPEFGDIEDEFPYIGAAQKGLTDAKAYTDNIVEASIDDYDEEFTQQKVFDRLTGNGAAQGLVLYNGELYVNASYINAGYMSANHIQGGTLTLGGANNVNGTLQILDANSNVIGLMNSDGLDITDGIVVAYNQDRTVRSILTESVIGIQKYEQHPGSGQYIWIDKASMSIRTTTSGDHTRYPVSLSSPDLISIVCYPISPVINIPRANITVSLDDGIEIGHSTSGRSGNSEITLDLNYSDGLHFTHYDNYGDQSSLSMDVTGFNFTMIDNMQGLTTQCKSGLTSIEFSRKIPSLVYGVGDLTNYVILNDNKIALHYEYAYEDGNSGFLAQNELSINQNGVTISGTLIVGGSIRMGTWDGTEIAVANGGTGATTASDARTNLGITPSNIGAIPTSEKGAASGVAELDSNGKVPTSQLPSYVDDVLEYSSISEFPATGESGKIYVAQDTNLTYRWTGSTYVEISPSLALGETSSTAYRGDRGKYAYDHAQAHGSAYASGLYKVTTNSEGHVTGATAVQKSDITALGIPGQDTTYGAATQSAAGLMSASDKTKLDGIASGAQVNSITGVKGNAEGSYRTGNVNLTTANIGAVALSGDTMTGDLLFSNSGTTIRQIRGIVGDNDYWRIAGGATAANGGWMEIATADDGNEPIYVRQYTGVYSTVTRTLTLLDSSGNTTFPGTVTATGFSGPLTGNVTGNCSGSSGSCTGNAANVTGTVGIDHGGTGATTKPNARKALFGDAMADKTQYFITINDNWANGGYITNAKAAEIIKNNASGSWGISVTGKAANVTGTVEVDHGGTGATSASGARSKLGIKSETLSDKPLTSDKNYDLGNDYAITSRTVIAVGCTSSTVAVVPYINNSHWWLAVRKLSDFTAPGSTITSVTVTITYIQL